MKADHLGLVIDPTERLELSADQGIDEMIHEFIGVIILVRRVTASAEELAFSRFIVEQVLRNYRHIPLIEVDQPSGRGRS